MDIDYAYIFDVLRRFENSGQLGLTKGYVPTRGGVPLGQSGVTIGTGLDLGQQTLQSLRRMGIDQGIIGHLVPYLGLKRYDAINKLKSLPLTLSREAVDRMDQAVMTSYVNQIKNNFNKDRRTVVPFENRHKQVQAVICSLAYQFGTTGRGFPSTWGKIVSGDYQGAVDELRTPGAWGNKYMTRRRGEADILSEAVNAQ